MSRLLSYVTGFVLMISQANAIEVSTYKNSINETKTFSSDYYQN